MEAMFATWNVKGDGGDDRIYERQVRILEFLSGNRAVIMYDKKFIEVDIRSLTWWRG